MTESAVQQLALRGNQESRGGGDGRLLGRLFFNPPCRFTDRQEIPSPPQIPNSRIGRKPSSTVRGELYFQGLISIIYLYPALISAENPSC